MPGAILHKATQLWFRAPKAQVRLYRENSRFFALLSPVLLCCYLSVLYKYTNAVIYFVSEGSSLTVLSLLNSTNMFSLRNLWEGGPDGPVAWAA